MSNVLNIKNITIGKGIPKVIVPIVAVTKEEIIAKAKEISELDVHMVEWRADFYEEIMNIQKVVEVLGELEKILAQKILLFTFRTSREGGNRDISAEDYKKLNLAVAESGKADMVDLEVLSLGKCAEPLVAQVQSHGCFVVGSNHNFSMTPSRKELVERLIAIQKTGVDIPKIAVMPQCEEDLLSLLGATLEMSREHAEKPIITMSMAPLGMLSRISGEVFGSAMTFAAVGKVSAPGQIPVEALKTAQRIIHESIQ